MDSNVYRVRVLGEFPKQDDDTVISLAQVEDASVRAIEPEGKVVWGLDVARFGNDRTALCRRRGNVVTHKVLTWRNKDIIQIQRGLVCSASAASAAWPAFTRA